MRRIFLAAYSVQLNKTGKKSELVDLTNYNGNQKSLLDDIELYLKSIMNNRTVDQKSKQTIWVKDIDVSNSLQRKGTVVVGEYGFESTGFNVSANVESFKRTENDAEEIPYYYCFHIAPQSHTGLLILQRFGNSGVREPLTSSFVKEFNQNHSDIKLKISPLAIADVLSEFMNSDNCVEVTLIQSTIPKELSERLEWQRTSYKQGKVDVRKYGTIEMTIKPNRFWKIGGMKKQLNKIRDKSIGVSSLIEMPDFKYDDAVVTLELNGRKKKFLLSKEAHARTYLDVTDECVLNGGHPTFKSIDKATTELIDDLKNVIKVV